LASHSERGAAIVFDLGFGDAGKGLVTDYLVRSRGARAVVRFNGGAQAGHNVITPDGRHHTFSQLGAGSFVAGVETVLSRHMVVHPTALGVEAAQLERSGVHAPLERVLVSESALVITPFQQAAGRLRELARGAQRHGSCGVGVGEAMRDALSAQHEPLRMRDLTSRIDLRSRLEQQRAAKHRELEAELAQLTGHPLAQPERALLESHEVAERWLEAARAIVSRVHVRDDAALNEHIRAAGSVIFEGAQGVLLDEWRGFHPYTSWSTCTPQLARELAAPLFAAHEITTLGVLRTYATRHGAGPFPTEHAPLEHVEDPHNVTGPWQGPLRTGAFDAVLARYALEVSGPVDGLVLTHIDALARMAEPSICTAYRAPDGSQITRLPPSTARDLEHQARLTELLMDVTPIVQPVCSPADPARGRAFVQAVEQAVGQPVVLTSHGPTARHVQPTRVDAKPGLEI